MNNVITPPPITTLTTAEIQISPEWLPCYQMHRVQRILAADPCLSTIENFLLRMSLAKEHQRFFTTQTTFNEAWKIAAYRDVQPFRD